MTLLGAQTAVWASHRRESGKGCPWVQRPGQGQALPQHPWVALGQSLDCRGPHLQIAVGGTLPHVGSLRGMTVTCVGCYAVECTCPKKCSKNVRCCWYWFQGVVSRAQGSSALIPSCTS